MRYSKPIHDGPKTNRIGKIQKDSNPGSCSYNENDAFYKTALDSPVKWCIGKAKRITYTCEQADRKANIPSPAAYRPENTLNVSIGERGKLGYYNKVNH
jgi:hypothetical protein